MTEIKSCILLSFAVDSDCIHADPCFKIKHNKISWNAFHYNWSYQENGEQNILEDQTGRDIEFELKDIDGVLRVEKEDFWEH